jgi:uncharacterized protein YneF (UPF0154 family)
MPSKKSRKKKDKIDWKDDALEFGAILVVVIMALLFHDFLLNNPSITAVLQPERIGVLALSFGLFGGVYLLIKHLNREEI